MCSRRTAAFVAIVACATVTSASAAKASLSAAGRSLVPADRAFLVRGPVRERDCFVGGGKTARCVEFNIESVGLSYSARKRLLLANAHRHGWTLTRKHDYSNGSGFFSFRRGAFRAVLGIGPESAGSGGRIPTFVRVTQPSTKKRAGLPPVHVVSHASGPAKQGFLAAANSLCRKSVARIRRIPRGLGPDAGAKRYRGEVDHLIRRLDGLRPPAGDERAVARVLAEFRRFSQALGFLVSAKGENALGAAAAIAVTSKRAQKAASAYGLRACLPLFG